MPIFNCPPPPLSSPLISAHFFVRRGELPIMFPPRPQKERGGGGTISDAIFGALLQYYHTAHNGFPEQRRRRDRSKGWKEEEGGAAVWVANFGFDKVLLFSLGVFIRVFRPTTGHRHSTFGISGTLTARENFRAELTTERNAAYERDLLPKQIFPFVNLRSSRRNKKSTDSAPAATVQT